MREHDKELARVRKETQRGRVIALDIDECSVLGNDTNDILQIIALMTEGFHTAEKKEDVQAVLDLLINPQMVVAIREIRRQTALSPYIVFYTMKSGIVTCCTSTESQKRIILDQGLSLDSQDPITTIAFNSADMAEGFEYLYNQIGDATLDESNRQSLAYTLLCRLGIVTWGISRALGLAYAAPVYLTCKGKNMDRISKHLGVPFAQAFLFDDRAKDHAAELNLHENQAHMITTPPFHLSENSAQQLYEILISRFPMTDSFREDYPTVVKYASHMTMEMPLDPVTKDWKLYSVAEHPNDGSISEQPWDLDLVLAA